VLNTLLGKVKETDELKARLAKVDGGHRAVRDWKEKKGEFGKAAAKYSPKFEVAS